MTRVPPGILRLTVGPVETNCYLVLPARGTEATAIDPGGDACAISRELKSRGLSLGQILLTHAHIDHVMGIAGLLDACGPAPVACHPADGALWEAMALQADFLGVPVPRLPEAVEGLAHGTTITVGGIDMEIIHTPGHSPGGVCIAPAGMGVLFSGDTLFRDGVGRTDLWGGSWEHLVRSIRERILPLPPATVILPGHGEPTTVEQARCWAEAAGVVQRGAGAR